MSSDLGFAIVGVGTIADFHARALKEVKGARLVAAYSRTREKTAAFADKHGIAAAENLPTLLARKDVDVVCVTTPSGAHLDVAIPAFKAGKHVFCEKPLDVSLKRIDAMIAAAKKTKRHLAAIFQSRFGRGARTLKHAITEGRFGRISLCDAYIKWWRTQEYYDSGAWRGTWELDGGGALMNQGIHAIDLLQWLAGMPLEVSAQVNTLAHSRIQVEDTAVAALKYPNGALGVIEGATSSWPGFLKRIEISGDKGSAILEDDRLIFWKFEKETPEDDEIRARAAQASAIGGGASDPKAISTEGHRVQMQDLADAIRENRSPAVPGAEARKAVQLILAIYRSAKTGRKVALKS
ncbi:MAG: Gfo/Idh/MocA family oxidoreductase [Verrucomicrobia bacterium]|nr:Gfo/Idh/MocA family oxidoreductase [Verrucomicrobiota bacterium]